MSGIDPRRGVQDDDFARYLVEQIARWGRSMAQIDIMAAWILSDGGRFILAPLVAHADDGAVWEALSAIAELGSLGVFPGRPPGRASARRPPALNKTGRSI